MEMYDELQPLMILDPHLLTAFVFVCPNNELHLLFKKIPSFFATAWLLKTMKENNYTLKDKVSSLAI